MKTFEYGKAICYSGYREGQHPEGEIPTKEQIREDLAIILADGYRYIRMYEPNEFARRTLDIIREDGLPFKCLVGVDNYSEINNPDCPWDKQEKLEEELAANAIRNDKEVEKLIAMAKEYSDLIIAVSVGNENTPCWGARIVSEARLVEHAKQIKAAIDTPVTFCEGYPEWENLDELASVLDIIGVHSYPLHNGIKVEDALEFNQVQYKDICDRYPDKEVVFTEVGWSSQARDDLKKDNATEENQAKYIKELVDWMEKDQVVGFLFEVFDEPWKGEDPYSCERNWGLYYVDRTPKPVMKLLKK